MRAGCESAGRDFASAAGPGVVASWSMDARLRAVCDLMVPEAREFAGLHDYDGQVQDLSPDSVRRGLPPSVTARRWRIHPTEAHPAAFEQLHRAGLDELELHRRNVLPHLANLDLARCPVRAAVDAALAALDRLSAPVAGALSRSSA